VRLDGVLLACSDAALSLFGVGTLGGILKTNLTDRLVAADRAKWQEFTARVWANGAASLACQLVPDDGVRPVVIQGIALKDHPDGVDSLLLSLRDQSQTHRLEHSIQTAEIIRVGQEERQRAARDQVEETIAERRRLAALADEHQAECRRLTEAVAEQTAERERREATFVELEKRVEESQLASLGKEREHRARVAVLEAALAAAHADHATRASADDKHPAQTGQQQPVSGERNRRELADVELFLKASMAEQARLRALVGDHQVQRDQIAAEHQAAVATLEQSLAIANREGVLSRDLTRETLVELRSQLAQALAERDRLAVRVEEQEGEREGLTAEHQRALGALETRKLRALVIDHEIQRERIAAEHQAAVATLEQSLALAEREAALNRDLTRETLSELRSQLAKALAEQSRLAARAEEHEGEREGMTAEHQRALGALETRKLRALVGDHEIQRERIAAEHRAAVATLEQSLALANQEAALGRDQTRQTLAELRSQLAQAIAEQSRLAARVEEHEGEREGMTAEHQRALGDLETRRREALADLRSQLSQALTEQGRVAARAEEEHERERDRMSADYHRVLADLETSKREALATLRSQVSQVLAEQGRLTAQAYEDHELERDRMSAEHQRSIADLETSKRDALAYLHSQVSQTAAEERRLAARAEELERERDRVSIDHQRAIADLETRRRDALAELRSQLSQTSSAEKSRLAERIEELERERDRMSAEHRGAIADLQASKAEALAECERLLTEIHQSLLFRDGLAGVERRLIDAIDETQQEKVDGERLAELQGGLTLAISKMQTVLAHGDALQEPLEADDASVRERAERAQAEAIVGIKPRASSTEDS
jgi:hypothetical protein